MGNTPTGARGSGIVGAGVMSKHHREIPAQVWARLRRETFDRDSYRCRECGKAGSLGMSSHDTFVRMAGATLEHRGADYPLRDCHLGIHRRMVSEADREWLDFLGELGA